jgi:hypothetical protein
VFDNAKSAQFERMQTGVKQLEGEVKQLEGEVKRMEGEVKRMQATLSWRITAPLRAVRRLTNKWRKPT